VGGGGANGGELVGLEPVDGGPAAAAFSAAHDQADARCAG